MTRIAGLVLIGLGVIGIAWGGFTYTTREKVIDVGPIHATRDQSHNFTMPPLVGGVMLIAGAVMMLAGKKV